MLCTRQHWYGIGTEPRSDFFFLFQLQSSSHRPFLCYFYLFIFSFTLFLLLLLFFLFNLRVTKAKSIFVQTFLFIFNLILFSFIDGTLILVRVHVLVVWACIDCELKWQMLHNMCTTLPRHMYDCHFAKAFHWIDEHCIYGYRSRKASPPYTNHRIKSVFVCIPIFGEPVN